MRRFLLILLMLGVLTLAIGGCGGPATVSVGVGVYGPAGWGGVGPYGPTGSVWIGMPPGGYVYH